MDNRVNKFHIYFGIVINWEENKPVRGGGHFCVKMAFNTGGRLLCNGTYRLDHKIVKFFFYTIVTPYKMVLIFKNSKSLQMEIFSLTGHS